MTTNFEDIKAKCDRWNASADLKTKTDEAGFNWTLAYVPIRSSRNHAQYTARRRWVKGLQTFQKETN